QDGQDTELEVNVWKIRSDAMGGAEGGLGTRGIADFKPSRSKSKEKTRPNRLDRGGALKTSQGLGVSIERAKQRPAIKPREGKVGLDGQTAIVTLEGGFEAPGALIG